MLAIRLQRIGRKNRPSFRLVVSEKSRDMFGVHNEILGHYNPSAEPKQIELNAERIKYWLSVGAQASDTVHNLLIQNNVIEGKKVKAWTPKKKAGAEAAASPAPAPAAPAEPKPEEPAKTE